MAKDTSILRDKTPSEVHRDQKFDPSCGQTSTPARTMHWSDHTTQKSAGGSDHKPKHPPLYVY
eukprot:401855-Prymnesium_polylepis.1